MREITILTDLTQEQEESKAFIYTHRTQYYETDQMGIIHHSNYIRWFEEARMAFMEEKGYSMQRLEERGILIPVLSATCTYKKLVRLGEQVDIQMVMHGLKGIKFKVDYKVLVHDTGELRAFGQTGHGFVNAKMQPIWLKKEAPDVYDFFKSYMEE